MKFLTDMNRALAYIEAHLEEELDLTEVARIPLVYEGENPAITKMGEQITEEIYNKLQTLANVAPYGGYNASFNFTERENEANAELNHLIGVATTKTDWLGLEGYPVPALTWAIFDVVGSTADIQQLWGQIYSEWLPSSNYQIVEGPEILFTARPENPESDSITSEIWVPVEFKQ